MECVTFLLRLSKYSVQSFFSSAYSSGASHEHRLIILCHMSSNLFLFLAITSVPGGLGVSGFISRSSHLYTSSITFLGSIPLRTAVAAGAGGEGGAVHVVGVVLDRVGHVVGVVHDWVDQVVVLG